MGSFRGSQGKFEGGGREGNEEEDPGHEGAGVRAIEVESPANKGSKWVLPDQATVGGREAMDGKGRECSRDGDSGELGLTKAKDRGQGGGEDREHEDAACGEAGER